MTVAPLQREIEAALRDVGCSMSGFEIRTWIEVNHSCDLDPLDDLLDALVAAGVLRDGWEAAPESPVGRRRIYRLADDRCPP